MGNKTDCLLYKDTALGSSDITNKDLRLSIELTLNGFSFSVDSMPQGLHLAVGSYTFRYGQASEQRLLAALVNVLETVPDISQLTFSTTHAMFLNTEFTMLPSELFSNEKASEYLGFTLGREIAPESASYDVVEKYGMTCVYRFPQSIVDYLSSRCAAFERRHSSSVFLSSAAPMSLGTSIHVNADFGSKTGCLYLSMFSISNRPMTFRITCFRPATRRERTKKMPNLSSAVRRRNI